MTSIIWDMGGTLVDTYPQVDRTLARTVWGEDPGERELAEVAVLRTRSISHAIDALSRRHGVPAGQLEAAYADLKDHWRTAPAPLMEGAGKVMDAVRVGGGLNLVATHRDRDSAEALLAALGVEVDDLVCAPDGLARKPDPAMNLLLMDRHGLSSSDVICIGDREIDVAAASAAGCRSVLLAPAGPTATSATWQVQGLGEVLGLLR